MKWERHILNPQRHGMTSAWERHVVCESVFNGTDVWCCVSVTVHDFRGGLWRFKDFQFGVVFKCPHFNRNSLCSDFQFFSLQYLKSIFTAWRHFFGVLPSMRLSWWHASLRFLSCRFLFSNYSMSLCFSFLSLFRNLLMRPEYFIKTKSYSSRQEIICIANSNTFLVPKLSEMNSHIIRSINPLALELDILIVAHHLRKICHRPATSWVHYTTSCNTQSSPPEDGQNNCPKIVELIGIINKPLLLNLVGC